MLVMKKMLEEIKSELKIIKDRFPAKQSWSASTLPTLDVLPTLAPDAP